MADGQGAMVDGGWSGDFRFQIADLLERKPEGGGGDRANFQPPTSNFQHRTGTEAQARFFRVLNPNPRREIPPERRPSRPAGSGTG
jgi:hypothetical protein